MTYMDRKMDKKTGFTLVELIIVIAIMAVLIGIAVPVYNDHLNETRMVKVLAHYDTAIRAARNHLALTATQQARGTTATLPASSAAWIQVIDPDSTALAPSGDAAYAALVDDTKGVVGVDLSDDGSQLTITRPKYASLAGETDGSNVTTVIDIN